MAIARALANDPPILVADEPTGNLDSKTADSVFRMFESLVDQGKTILMVTHDRDLAERVTRTVIISDGEIIEEYLAKVFPGLTEQQLVQAMRQLDRQTFPPGATVIREGAPPRTSTSSQRAKWRFICARPTARSLSLHAWAGGNT